ncbi:Uncharacterized protein FWK35_00000621 [Aphis craccivora]|uniref:Uncharacterized protein n=1 Tax=Aphis craccivora TaxID=307492 RepID=A0A6G0Z5P9_APHCR|nr:Uncharacterized protein FWK35_00000621 [Aphis craccivora]
MLNDWCITENVQAFCCDTTASNTGRRLGAFSGARKMSTARHAPSGCLSKVLVLKCAFYTKLCTTSRPDVLLFKWFQQYWGNLNTEKFEPGTINEFIQKNVSDVRSDVINFVVDYLPPLGIFLRVPGAIHHARRMAKAI